jgi:hypothetical protein
MAYNEEKVERTLQSLIPLLLQHKIKYRFLGSIAVAALNGKPHRRIGDIDLVIDERKHLMLRKALLDAGYEEAGGMFAFARKYLSLETLIHRDLLSVGYFYGKWKKYGAFEMGNRVLKVSIDSWALKPTTYSLAGLQLIGIAPEIIATGIRSSARNPKRKKELELLKQKEITPAKNNYIHVQILGVSVDWVYHAAMGFLNILGMLRIRLGLPFDPWRSQIK